MLHRRPHLIDIWEPTEHVEGDGTTLTHSYTKTYSDVPCTFQPLGGQKRMMAGIDMTEPAFEVYLTTGRVTRISELAVFCRTDEAGQDEGEFTFWRPVGVPSKWTRHWEFNVVEGEVIAEAMVTYGE